MKPNQLLPWIAGGVALLATLATMIPPAKVRGFDLDGFSRLPVLEGGRVKPIDSVARNSLLVIRSKQSVPFEKRTVGAGEWLLDVMFRPEVADRMPSFAIDDPEVLGLIGVKQSSQRYYSFETLAPHLEEIEKQANAAHRIDAKQRTRYQGAVANLFERVYLYYKLKNTVQIPGAGGLAAELQAVTGPGSAERHAMMAQLAHFRFLPPPAGKGADGWRSVGEGLRDAAAGSASPALPQLARMSAAYAAGDAPAFNAAVAEIRSLVGATQPAIQSKAGSELLFNRAQPFYIGIVLYVLAMLLVFVSWLWKPDLLQPTALALVLVGLAVHTAGLVARTLLQGYAPVTNLYSSAVFVGWGAVILGVVLERIYRRGIGTVVATACGFSTLIIAHHLASDGDTMEMMRAVLDSNFWLGTHVTTITIGYSGTFVAGAIAIAWTIYQHAVKRVDPGVTKALASMTYGVVCFGLFFSFVGTVLGGIWADQSWGRFWGWDPKENGALLIVLWNAIILHARWGGYARERGIMTMAIFGNVITSLSWFGVNMLGVGLHSYGFMDKAFWALSGFVASQLVLMGFSLAPRRFWERKGTSAAPGVTAAKGA